MSRPATIPQSRRERRARARLEPRPSHPRSRRAGSRPAWRSPFAIATLAAAALGLVAVAIAWRPVGPTTQLVAGPSLYPAELTDGPVLGSASAPVVMLLYADFQCPACKEFVTGQLPRLLRDYVVPGTLRIEARDIDILGRGSVDESLNLAAGAACAAEQDRYWPFHDLVFWNQGRENRGDHDAAFIAAAAADAGIDSAAWNTCLARADVRQAIVSRTAAATGAGLQYTPTLVINGETRVGVPSYAELTALIDRLAAAAPASSAQASSAPAASAP